MRRVWLLLWALWFALAPIGSAWAYACACTGQPALICCKNYTAGEGEPPFAPTPLSHPVGEGLGVRANKCERLACSEPKQCTLVRGCRSERRFAQLFPSLALAWNRLAPALDRLASAWNRLAPAWNRLVSAWDRLASAWS